MDIFTTPAVNLLGVGLFQATIHRIDDTTDVVTFIVPEFFLEKFFEEFEQFREEHNAHSDMEDLAAMFPVVYGYIFEGNSLDLNKSELVELNWGINFEVGSPFPRYFQGLEIR